MRCPFCSTRDSRVIDTRELSGGDSIRRRRECVSCNRRFTTYERVESTGLLVVKKDGRREEFSQSKLRDKLRLALTKRPVGEADIDRLVQQVESDMLAKGTPEVTSSDVGEAVLRRLRDIDEVAYIRFASVYRQFADIDDLRRAVEGLGARKPE
jgi:transcriptional repressor NrdR